eukprot:gene16663-22784_t
MSLRVICNGDIAELNNVGDKFSFIEFDNYVRSRFGIVQGCGIVFKAASGSEIFPTKENLLSLDTVLIENLPNIKTIFPKIDSEEEKPAIVKQKSSKPNPIAAKRRSTIASITYIFDYSLAVFTAVSLLSILTGALVQHHVISQSSFAAHHFAVSTDEFFYRLAWLGNKELIVEAFIAFLTWSTTYLFIRRLMNPETAEIAISRFSFDAFFGGLAAAAAVILKSYLHTSLIGKRH